MRPRGAIMLGIGLIQAATLSVVVPAKAKHVIHIFLEGAPSHIDTWDPKPEMPAEIRGPFQPIATCNWT